MGNGKSQMVSAECSCINFANEKDLNTIISTPNCNKGNKRNNGNHNDEFSNKFEEFNCKKNSKINLKKINNCNCMLPKSVKPKMQTPVVEACECKYSLEALTAEEQLEEVETVFKEKGRSKAGENSMKRQNGSGKGCATCCECAKALRRIEKRNGLQKVATPNQRCQCCSCKGQIGKLSEAQAIADAIQEYCCRERKRALEVLRKSRNAKRTQRCCMCNSKIAEDEMNEDDEFDSRSYNEMEDDCCCSQFKEYPKEDGQKSKRKSKKAKELEKDDEDNDDNDNEYAIEDAYEDEDDDEDVQTTNVVITQQKRRQPPQRVDNEQQQQQQPKRRAQVHAKGCTCCDCKKQQNAINHVEDAENISVDDIEFEVQSQNERNDNRARTHKSVSEVEETETEILHEREVFMKKTNLKEQAEDEVRPNRRGSSKERRIADRRDISDGPHVKGCRCCDCKKTAENKSKTSKEYVAEERVPNRRSNLNANEVSQPRSRQPTTEADRPKTHRSSSSNRKENITSQQEYQRKRERNRLRESAEEGAPSRNLTPDRNRNERNPHQSRRYSRNMADESNLSQGRHSKNCQCCECKKQKLDEDDEAAFEDEDEEAIAEIEVEVEEERKRGKQSCCCFIRKRPPKASSPNDDQPTNGKRTEKQRGSSDKDSSKDRKRSGERKEPQKRPKSNTEQHSQSKSRQRESSNSATRKRNSSRAEQECQRECKCKKNKRVPLTKCCLCTRENEESSTGAGTAAVGATRATPARAAAKNREHIDDMKQRELAEELADRIQRRAQLQIALQKRLQDQKKSKQKQRCCCGCYSETPPSPPPPCCCIPMSCCEQSYGAPPPQPCCFQANPCCFSPSPPQSPGCCEPSPCCYQPPPSFGQECPCCCQPMPFCYSASCSYSKPGPIPSTSPC